MLATIALFISEVSRQEAFICVGSSKKLP